MGCRKRAAKHQLLRVTAVEGVCVPDPRGALPGRGAYLHPEPACLDLAVRRRAFPRAFRLQGALDTERLRGFLGERTGGTPAP
ncbi:YlxR family protein [Kitasatospora sp. NPDC004240]